LTFIVNYSYFYLAPYLLSHPQRFLSITCTSYNWQQMLKASIKKTAVNFGQ